MRSQICGSTPISAVLLISALLLTCSNAGARCIPFDPGYVASEGGRVLLVPDGSGTPLADVGATITVQLWRCPGEPYGLADYPAQDMWLDTVGPGTLAFCAPGAIADGPTDEDGIATFSRALAGGGEYEGDIFVRLGDSGELTSAMRWPAYSFPFSFVSPDMNGDLIVDLHDFATFGADYGSAEPRSDFDFDGNVDLYDFRVFGNAYGVHCP